VKICAESQLDSPVEKSAAVIAVHKYIKQGTVLKDLESIELLEWAIQPAISEREFSETLGPLRVRLVKGAPKDKASGTRCLESCLLRWDLVSAQQIAAILDKSCPSERNFLFWNIVITHLLAIDERCPPEKSKLYGMLALRQILRAAQMAEQVVECENLPDRAVQTEEEILLLYGILEVHGTDVDWSSVMDSTLFSPLAQFRLGRKEPLLRALDSLQRQGNFKGIYDLTRTCLESLDENGRLSLLASDWSIWKRFITAAANLNETIPG
jgi:N-terminal acetyltransferase B complex non-catalytic subunit